jgi:hypothetical protein
MSEQLDLDMNTSNYSLSELMAIAGIEEMDPEEIVEKTNKYINQFKEKNPRLSVFFHEIQSQLLQYASSLGPINDVENDYYDEIDDGLTNLDAPNAEFPEGEKQTNDWINNEYLQQKDENQNKKITQRKQKIDVYGNVHVPMNRETLGVNNTFNLPVAQDVLNPNLKNVISRFINLDSQFRQYSSGSESSSTDYTLDLSDSLKNVLSMKLFSYQIPYSWYVIDVYYANTCFWITDDSTDTKYNISISIEKGNYSISEFQDALNNALISSGFTNFTSDNPITIDSKNALLTINIYGSIYTDPTDSSKSFTVTESTILTFYDFSGELSCSTNQVCFNKSNYLNQTLGWIMGFRVPFMNVSPVPGNTGTAIVDLNGTKYLILVIDDYNQNHVNNGLVSITEFNSNLKLPNYYSPDLPYTCMGPNLKDSSEETNKNSNFLISNKLDVNYSNTQVILPSAPRTLTLSQIYSINEINKNHYSTNYKASAPTTTDILAIIPIKTAGVSTGSLLVEFSGSLQDNIRIYFGPVNIERMRVRLLDDKGNQLNLNGGDWCITLIVECLYQY